MYSLRDKMGLADLFKSIIKVGEAFIKLGKLLGMLIKFFFEIIPKATTILNPVNLLNDIVTGAFLGIQVLFNAIFNSLNIRNLFNICYE